MTTEPHHDPVHVLIAGGGVAALEAMMALRALAGDRVRITLLAPERDFHYRPMAVAEPFSIAQARRIALVAVAADFDAQHVNGALAGVEADKHRIVTASGERMEYDALVIACGTRAHPAFDGVVTVDDRSIGATLRGLVQDVEDGYTHRVTFVAPAQAFWPLPIYELALLTARRAFDANAKVDIAIVSPEAAPLALFGGGISRALDKLLDDAGIVFHGSSFAEYAAERLTLRPSGTVLEAGRVVSMPLLDGPQITGVPADPHGFVAVSDYGEVFGLDDVYAAGDVTSYPIKHGGIASQQADVVAAAIAARAGVGNSREPLRPVVRAVLMTGRAPLYLEATLSGDEGLHSVASDTCPWDPPTKIAARYLGPYLERGDRYAVGA
jgi:sulfide:quinone oxidoreductase